MVKFQEQSTVKISSSIQQRMEIFSENGKQLQSPERTEIRKLFPGKLKMNLAINVAALKPGAARPKIVKKSPEKTASESPTKQLENDFLPLNNTHLYLLNNDAIKSRARIKTKRLPFSKGIRRDISNNLDKENVKEAVEKNKATSQAEPVDETMENLDKIMEKPEIVENPTEVLVNNDEAKTEVFKVGAKVKLQDRTVRQTRSHKLGAIQWLGPYIVVEKADDKTYKIKLGRRTKLVDVNDLQSYR